MGPLVGSIHRRITFAWLALALIVLACAALIAAAALVPAPPGVLPFIVVACIGSPMAATFELAHALAMRRDPSAELRRQLDRLPETPHPLGY
jgi:hypothetical protein